MTSACNLDCAYCYNVWKSPRRSYPRGSQPLAHTLRVIDRVLEELPLEAVAITGGEPFLRSDLPQLVAQLWARHLKVIVITNGTLLTPERVGSVAGVTNYELPLLSYRREIHDRLTRVDAFDRVVAGALNLRRAGEHFAIAFIATRLNYADLERTLDLAIALGAEGLLYNRMNVAANNYPHLDELLPTPEMIRENLDALESFGARYPFPISCSIPLPPCLIDTRSYPHVSTGFCPLGRDDSYFTIDPLGNLRVCNHSSAILGNLLEHSFSELYAHPFVERFMTQMPPGCLDCPPAVRDACHGGCPCAADECYGTFLREEPFLECHLPQRRIPLREPLSSG